MRPTERQGGVPHGVPRRVRFRGDSAFLGMEPPEAGSPKEVRMRRSVPLWSAALAAAPLAISHVDSSVTELRVAGGKGSYAYITRGCDNSVISKERIDYDNVGAEVSHKFTAPVSLGMRAGIVRPDAAGRHGYESPYDVRYVNRYLSFDWPGFSIGGGLVKGDQYFPEVDLSKTGSGHIRIGKGTYFEFSYFEAVPLVTTGYGQMGLGFRRPRMDFWLGVAAVPQDMPGFVGRGEYRIGDRLGVGGTLRLGSSEGVSENAFAVALSYRFIHRSTRVEEPDRTPAPHEPLSAPWWPEPAPPDSATAPAASDSVRSPRRGRSRAPRDRRSRRALC